MITVYSFNMDKIDGRGGDATSTTGPENDITRSVESLHTPLLLPREASFEAPFPCPDNQNKTCKEIAAHSARAA
jgi:hypothetical protein